MIYAITCLTKLEERNTWPEFGAMAFMGYFTDKSTAFHAVKTNASDIAEHCFNYAVIEEIPPGLYACPSERWFFQYEHENNCFKPIDEPAFMKHIGNIL